MTREEMHVPEIGRIDSAGTGLLRTLPSDEGGHRLEDWIASNLDASPGGPRPNHWNALIKNLPVAPDRSPAQGRRRNEPPSAWSRFQLVYKRGVTVVRLVDRNLIQKAHIDELGQDLMDLIAVGNHRVVLNFSAVERLGSWIIGVVGNAHRACASADGGRLKICGMDAALAEVLEIVGMARDLEFHPGEAEALDSPWPEPSAPRGLPVDLLSMLLRLGELPPIQGGAPGGSGILRGPAEKQRQSGPAGSSQAADSDFRVSLRVQAGTKSPRTVRVPPEGLLIGRGGQCSLRIGSALVSKRHAAIELRDHRPFLRDLESTNGTTINGQTVRGLERELSDGDTVQIGPLSATVVIGPCPGLAAGDEDDPLGLFSQQDEPALTSPLPDEATVQDVPNIGDADQDQRIRVEVLEDVLVVTPQFEHLGDEPSVDALRGQLQDLFESSSPRRVVVNLEFLSHLSRQAVAMLLSHHIRLEWAGGGMRLCQAHPRIIALLDQVRLTMLVDYYPTLDEAVLASWNASRAAAQP